MCGIFGVISTKNLCDVFSMIQHAFEKLEYRGSDSFGFLGYNTEITHYERRTTGITGINDVINNIKKNISTTVTGGTAIAHNRWSTNGASTEANAHPHAAGNFYVVHNGIISNEQIIKNGLLKDYKFKSETDTEVICALAQKFFIEGTKFEELGEKLRNTLKGSYSFVLVDVSQYKNWIVVRNGLGLSLALSDDYKMENGKLTASTMLVSSEENALFSKEYPEINKKLPLANGDIFVVVNGEGSFNTNKDVNKLIENVEDLNRVSVSKGHHKHFMIKEIYDQQDSIMNAFIGRCNFTEYTITLPNERKNNNDIPIKSDDEIREALKNTHHIRLIACGTSYHACLSVQNLFHKMFNKPVIVEVATNFEDSDTPITKDDIFIFVSQSGETADLLSVQNKVNKVGAVNISFVNKINSELGQHSHYTIDLKAGPEIAVASTKAYTSQITNLTLFAIAFSTINTTEMNDFKKRLLTELQKIPEHIKTILESLKVTSMAEYLKSVSDLLLVGRGYHRSTILEGALKIKEITYLHAEGIPAGELKHGSLALISKEQPVLMVICNDKFKSHLLLSLNQIRAKGGNPFIIVTEDIKNEFINTINENNIITIPKTEETIQSILVVIPLQLLAYYTAVEKGINPDMPRNLAKSVTVL